MKLLTVVYILAVFCFFSAQASRFPRSAEEEETTVQDESDETTEVAVETTASDDHNDDIRAELLSAPESSTGTVPLGIASIKSRAIAMDRGLCRERSRYHPHYPRCQAYCAKLDHWMGMCRRDSCHCYS